MGDTTTNDHTNWRGIPATLIPHLQICNVSWSMNNYAYHQYFDASYSIYAKNEEDYVIWATVGNKLRSDIQEDGVNLAEMEVVKVEKGFGIKTKNNQNPVNLNDILKVVADPIWYNENINHKREIVYRMAYLPFREGHNQWALNYENSLLVSRGLTYDFKERCHKGFVLKNLFHKESAKISRQFQRAMDRTHLECIAVRKQTRSEHGYTVHRFGRNSYYIADKKNTRVLTSLKQWKLLSILICQRPICLLLLITILLIMYHH